LGCVQCFSLACVWSQSKKQKLTCSPNDVQCPQDREQDKNVCKGNEPTKKKKYTYIYIYLKKGESIDVVWLTNSMEPPISQVISEIPTSGHPAPMRS